MDGVRGAFLDAVEAVTPLLGSPALGARWEEPSALDRFRVSGLAGHLLRATTSVEAYLDRPEPPAEGAISGAAYYTTVLADTDLGGEFHSAIRARGEEAAAGGPTAVSDAWEAPAERLGARLAAEAPIRLVRVFGDLVLGLDDYLRTRLVQLCVHADDLAASVGLPPPPLPEAATALAVEALVDVALLRHGDAAVLRALNRRERDVTKALRVL